jgi:peptidoglycan/LPS O-acetylase OafA/YrhL
MRFRILDSWRGIAALCVVLFHFEAADHIHALRFIRHSYLFVDFFFVLSGFVIAHAYGDRLKSPLEVWQFVVRRFGRVWPLHIAVLAAFIAVAVFKYALTAGLRMSATTSAFDSAGSTPLGSLPAQVLLLQAVDVTDRLTWNTPSWSISAEFWTYILFALIVLLLPRYRTVTFAVTAFLGAATVIAFSHHGMDVTYDLGLPRSIFGFSIGYLVYWARPRIGPMPPALAYVAEVLMVLAIFAFVTMTNRSPLSYAAPFVFAIAVYVFSYELGPVSRLLRRPVFQNLGLWSYSIYMVHALIAFVIGLAVSELQKRLGVDLWQSVVEDGISKRVIVSDHVFLLDAVHLVYAATVVAISAFSYRLIEQPGRRYFQGVGDRMAKFPAKRVNAVAINPSICQSQESR